MTDAIRAVHNGRYKYIRNYRPEQPYYLPVVYRERIPIMQELLRLKESGGLNAIQMQWFRESKPQEELFDVSIDPHELNNLAADPKYKLQLEELSMEMDRWLTDINDIPNKSERQLINELWQGADQKPTTKDPIMSNINGKVSIATITEGASIGYKIIDSKSAEDDVWFIYESPISLGAGARLKVQAHRIGYMASGVVEYRM